MGGVDMTVNADTPDMFELVDKDTELERLATGFTFTEGPIWNKEGGFLLFSDMPADVRRRWDETNGVREVMKPSNKCNGMTYEADGSLLVCEHVTSAVVRERPDGTRETVASHHEGKELNSPNDIIVADDGSILFTDPTYGRMPGFGLEREQDLSFQGVYLVPPGNGELTLLIDDFEQPNGLCFSPDESLLYINDTPRAHIRVFDWHGNSLANGRVFADKIGSGVIEEGVVDGMKCDERGNVYVSGPGGVWVFDPEGTRLGMIEIPENVGNLNWGGDGWNELYIPASTSVYRIRMKVAGNRLGYMR
jgi:gluconolactonase